MKTLFNYRFIVFLFSLCLTTSLSAQGIVSGIVKDAAGETIIGATIGIKGSNTGTITDIEGRFSLSTHSAQDVLVVSYIGFETRHLTLGDKRTFNIVLRESSKNLDEIIVVGYGTQKKSDLTGSIVSVKADEMNAIPTTSVAEMLRGQGAGIVITQSSARPGGSSDIVIRGKRSINGGNDPLFIVDGVPVTNIDDFNAQDILSVEVLKDASAQSIYGARASNGVILVTTRKGEKNKTTVDLNAYVGVQTLKRNFDLYDGSEWATLKREANRQYPNGVGAGGDYYLEDPSLFGPMYQNLLDQRFTDWESLMVKPAIQQKYDLSVRSGGEKTRLSASLGYFEQSGMVQPASYQRANFRFNVDHQILKSLSIGFTTNYTYAYRTQEDGSFSKYITQSPLLNPFDDKGELKSMLENSKWSPIWNNQNMLDETKTHRLLMNFYGDWEIVKGLKYRLNTSLNYRNSERGEYLNSKHEKGSTTNGQAGITTTSYYDYLVENILTYDYEINKDNKFDITLMQSVNGMQTTTNQMNAYGFTTDDLGYNAITFASKTDPIKRTIIPRNILSFMARARYNLMDKYLFSVSVRVDGASVFGVNNKWGVFPSGSFAWRLSEESFLKDVDWMSNLKLRASYGAVGNQAIDPYQSQGLVDAYYMRFGDKDPLVGFLPGSQLYNPNLKWETTYSANVGLDFGFLRDRITGTVEYYHATTTDLLMNKTLNETSGYSTQLVNMGSVLNQGVELTLNFLPVKTKDWTWSIDLNLAHNQNTITALDGQLNPDGTPKDDIANNWFVGHNIDAYYSYKADGIWQLGDEIPQYENATYKPQPGDIRIVDKNNDNKIDADDRYIIDRAPKLIGSIGTTLKWKGIDLSLDFYGVYGAVRLNSYLWDANSGGDLHGSLNGMKVDYWTPENPSNTAPRPRDATIDYLSSIAYQDASYFRLRNVSLGYSFPKRLIQKAKMSKLRLYATGTNLWTLTDFKSYSPEASAGAYPEPMTFVLGLNLSF